MSFVWRRHVGVHMRGINVVAVNQQNTCHLIYCEIMNWSLKELININVIPFLLQGLFRCKIPQNKSLFEPTYMEALSAAMSIPRLAKA